jgi:magnesium-transporting ATPase (P-type)
MTPQFNSSDAIPGGDWYALETDQVLSRFDARISGLTGHEAERRLQRFGPNRLRPVKKRGALLRFLSQFRNVLIYVLLAAGIMTLALAHWVDAGVIFAVVLLNALIGFIQEGKAEKALDAIRQLLPHSASVRRDGRFITLPAEQLVPGDVVALQSGDKVPADLRLIQLKELRIDEAMLTGESVSAEKRTTPVALHAPIGDRHCMAFSGTLVTYGQGQGVVVASGDQTEVGRISGMLGEVEKLTTPLLRQMATFGRWLTLGIAGLASLTFAYGLLVQSYPASEMFLAAVGLAVAAIPEGLPAIMTITLAVGVQRMAHRNAIIRRLPAVETLGSVTVICSDKTGTLTRNEMTVQNLVTATALFEVSGTGYDPHGEFSLDGRAVSPQDYPVLHELTQAGLLCNDATLVRSEERWSIHGDPTEAALISLALKAGLDQAFQREEWPRTDVIPFESQHRYMSTLHHDHAGHGFIYLKGAPERVLEMCLYQRVRGEDLPLDRHYWFTQMELLGQRGQRLLAIAFKVADSGQEALNFEDVQSGLTLLGIVGIIDPPRQQAVAAVRHCQKAGVRVKMITGDHSTTALAIGKRMGIGDGASVVQGVQLDELDDAQLHQVALESDVFARTSPEHKLRLVKALQAHDQVVAMTGDGVNDAPALKRADVGVAMGVKGTEAAKEAAEMVLADDNFASIAHAVEEGRTVYDNLKKSILFVLPTNGGEAMIIVAAVLMGLQLPITPVQILWVNMITAVTLALTLAFEPAERDIMQRRPRDPREPILSAFLLWRILFVSLILVAGSFGNFLWEREQGSSIETARTVAVNTLVMFEIFYLISARYLTAPALTLTALGGNRYVYPAIGILIVFQLLFTYAPFMQLLFGSTGIDAGAWLRITLTAATVLVLVEAEKALLRGFGAHRGP